MKVLHVPFCFAPDPFGGTEVYVANLARDLHGFGVDAMVAAPSETSRTYTIDDLRVRRFATTHKITDVGQLYGRGDELAATEFAKIIDEETPDIVHLHAFTSAVSLRLVEVTKDRGIPVIFTRYSGYIVAAPPRTASRGSLYLSANSAKNLFCPGR